MNSYQLALFRAEQAMEDHDARHAREMLAWYREHPEMLYEIVGEDADGRPIRGSRKKDLIMMCLPGWMEYCEAFARGRDVVTWQMPTDDGARVVDLEAYLIDWNMALRRHVTKQRQRQGRIIARREQHAWQQLSLLVQ